MQEIVIQDNNPDRLFFLFLVLAIIFIVCNIIDIMIKKKRLNELEKIKKKLQDNHEDILYQFELLK